MPQKVKGKRILKNGVTAGYVRQKDGSWRFRFLKGGVGTPRPIRRRIPSRRRIMNPRPINIGEVPGRPRLRRSPSNTRQITGNDLNLAQIYYRLKEKLIRSNRVAFINNKMGLNELMFGEPDSFNIHGIPKFTPKVHITIHAEYNRRRNAPAHITWGGEGHFNKVTIPLYRYRGELAIDYDKWKQNMRLNDEQVREIEYTQEYDEGIYLLEILNDVIMGR